jgi:hypothetical protein
VVLEERMFFFEKKNQKTFDPCRVVGDWHPTANKSFFASFFSKKEGLPFFSQDPPCPR